MGWGRERTERCVGGESLERDKWGREPREMLRGEGERREMHRGDGMLREQKKEKGKKMQMRP
jgi:hypothetical protein